jgi:hypothetical protein
MAYTRKLRLSPVGPLVSDSVSAADLTLGNGSNGMLWRAQGTAVDSPWLPVPVPGGPIFSLAMNLPGGFFYDWYAKLLISTFEETDAIGVLHTDIQIEEAGNPGVWVSVVNNAAAVQFPMTVTKGATPDSRVVSVENVLIDRTASPAITGVRLVLDEVMAGAGHFWYLPQQCSFVIEQFVQG